MTSALHGSLPDFFTLLGLPPRFELDESRLQAAARAVLMQVHPDRFATAGAAERLAAEHWSAHVHEAVKTLRQPVERGLYLCRLHGAQTDSRALAEDFLQRQMQWHERMDALHDAPTSERTTLRNTLAQELHTAQSAWLQALRVTLDEQHDYARALQLLNEGRFYQRLSSQLANEEA